MQQSDRTVITWIGNDYWGGALDILGAPNTIEMQAVLFANGSIRLNYRRMEVEDGIVGLLFPDALQASGALQPQASPVVPQRFDYPDVGGLPSYRAGAQALNAAVAGDAMVDLSSGEFPQGASHYEAFHYRIAPDSTELACQVIEAQGDKFDFLFWYSQFRIDQQEAGTPINTPIAEFSELEEGLGLSGSWWPGTFCSDGRLQGAYVFPVYIDSQMGRPDGNPPDIPDEFNYGVSLLAHELGHRWLAYVHAEVNGRTVLLNDGVHWLWGVHAPSVNAWQGRDQASPMGGSYWQGNGDGTYTQLDNQFLSPASVFPPGSLSHGPAAR